MKTHLKLGVGVALAMSFVGFMMIRCDRENDPKMSLAAEEVVVGQNVIVTFDRPLTGTATNQYWVALQPATAHPSDTTGRVVLERSDTTVALPARNPGEYEVRLHGQFPKKEDHLIQRARVVVVPVVHVTAADVGHDVEACLDRWLAARDLDSFGAPRGTVYGDGSPLLDKATGTTSTRWSHVVAKHPDVAQACLPSSPSLPPSPLPPER